MHKTSLQEHGEIRSRPRRGVRRGDTISPKLCTAILESVSKNLNWSRMKINGEYLNNIRFTDDIEPITVSLTRAQIMLQQLSGEASKVPPR